MAKETTYAGKLGDWQRLLEPLLANTAELGYLEVSRNQLATLIDQVSDLRRDQQARQAAKQILSQQLKGKVTEAERVATLLRQALKVHYGIRSEKLTEFGVQPFRGRKAAASSELPGNAGSSTS